MVPDPERLSSVCRPSIRADAGCARSLCSFLAQPSHPCGPEDPSRRRPPARALLEAGLPDRRTPRGARRYRRTRCVSPTCAAIDLPYEHPSRTVRLPLRFTAEDRVALDGAPPASAGLPGSPGPRGLRAPFGLRRRGCSCRFGPGSRAARTAGFFAKPRAALLGAAFSAAARASETASDAPCRTRHQAS
jgi:hypothetical protein